MTDESTPADPSDAEIERQAALAPDANLGVLVAFVNKCSAGTRFPITLTLSGQVIAGNLIPSHVWWADMRASVESGTTSPETAEVLLDGLWAPAFEMYAPPDRGADQPPATSPTFIAFLHLTGAYVVSRAPTTTLYTDVGAPRLRLTEVVGWSLGNYDADRSS